MREKQASNPQRTDAPQGAGAVPYPEYRDRPLDFCREVLGLEPWAAPEGTSGQLDIFGALLRSKSVAVRSGHKVGKTTSAAAVAWWFYCTHEDARVIMTAPTARQVKLAFWREVKRLRRIALKPLPCVDDKVPLDPATGVQSGDGREILGFTAGDADAFSGVSGANVLYIVDEAPGVDETIFEALQGNRAGGAWLLMFGNPTQTSGTFYNAFHGAREFFEGLHISSRDAALFAERKGVHIPGLATLAWADEMLAAYGEDSPIYQVRVLGNFPSQAENAVIALWLLEQASARWTPEPPDPKAALTIGVDVARFGDDDSVIQVVRGSHAYPPIVVRQMDGPKVAGAALAAARKYVQGSEVVRINVDVIGVGASVYDALKHTPNVGHWLRVVGVNSSAKSDAADKYNNLRSQLHFALRDWLREGGAIPKDSKLEAELIAPLYEFDNQGRLKVESKDEIKERLRRSPDRGDALMLAVYRGRGGLEEYDSSYDDELPSLRV